MMKITDYGNQITVPIFGAHAQRLVLVYNGNGFIRYFKPAMCKNSVIKYISHAELVPCVCGEYGGKTNKLKKKKR